MILEIVTKRDIGGRRGRGNGGGKGVRERLKGAMGGMGVSEDGS